MSGNDRSPLRARRPTSRHAPAPKRSVTRADALREIERELEGWRERNLPDPTAPLDAEAVARLVGDCLISVGLDEATATSFTVNTVYFYRRKEIIDPPEGRTSAARYSVRHLWQAIGARLAGQLALLTLAEAREAMAGRSERVLLGFVAERVLEARARQAARRSTQSLRAPTAAVTEGAPRPLPAPDRNTAGVVPAILVTLPGDAWCVVPASHPARRSAAAARALAQALAESVQVPIDTTLDS